MKHEIAAAARVLKMSMGGVRPKIVTESERGSASASETGETMALGIALIAERIVTKIKTGRGREIETMTGRGHGKMTETGIVRK